MSQRYFTKMKRCSKCGQVKQFFEFYKNRSRKDGYSDFCKICMKPYELSERNKAYQKSYQKEYAKTEKAKAYQRKYRQTEKSKEYQKQYDRTEAGKESRRERNRIYKALHPTRVNAHTFISNAITRGVIAKASTLKCWYCEQQAKEYHHYRGYELTNRLCIVPICQKCHNQFHKRIHC